MCGIQSARQFRSESCGCSPVPAKAASMIVEVSGQENRHRETRLEVTVDVENSQDIRMLQLRRRHGRREKDECHIVRGAKWTARDDLERDVAFKTRVSRRIDAAEWPAAEDLSKLKSVGKLAPSMERGGFLKSVGAYAGPHVR